MNVQAAEPAQDAKALFEQGLNHLNGYNATEDPLKAIQLFHQAAEAGYADAQYYFGMLCWHGDTPPLGFVVSIDGYLQEVTKCQPQARQWLEKAAAQGEWHAKVLLVEVSEYESLPREPFFFCLPSLDPEVAAWIDAAADAGNPDALSERAMRTAAVSFDWQSLPDFEHYKRALTQAEGNPKHTREIKRNARFAMKSMVMALRRGEPPSGLLSARTVPWLQRASAAGNADARSQLEELKKATQDKLRDDYRSVRWVEAAAMRGAAIAKYDLGYLYATGRCVTPDFKRAYELFEQARGGLPPAERQRAETALVALTASLNPDVLAEMQNHARSLRRKAERVGRSSVAPAYPSPDEALRTACDSTARAKWSGPWLVGNMKAQVGVLWEESQRTACMGYVTESPAGYSVSASTYVPTGFSARYNEYSPPVVLDSMSSVLHDQLLFFVGIQRMGLGGGGGDEIQIWSTREGGLHLLFAQSPVGYTDINTYTSVATGETDPRCREVGYGVELQGDQLRVRSCFDGRFQGESRYRFDGKQFVSQ